MLTIPSLFQGTSAHCLRAWYAEVVGDTDLAGICLMNVCGRKKIMLHRMITDFPGEYPQQKKHAASWLNFLRKGEVFKIPQPEEDVEFSWWIAAPVFIFQSCTDTTVLLHIT